MKKLNLIQVNTTAWDEEDFLLVTSLTEDQIIEVIEPIVEESREKEVEFEENEEEYTNDELVDALKKKYPNEIILHYTPDAIDLISI